MPFKAGGASFRGGLASRLRLAMPIVLAVCALNLPRSGFAQSSAHVTINSNEQLFCVMAALNVAGYDSGLFVNTGDDARQSVRDVLARKNIPVRAELARFYEAHRVQGNNLSQYISLALILGPPPEFSFTFSPQDLPLDASGLKGFVPLLRTFYREADLESLYTRLQPTYAAAIEKYSPTVRRQIALVDGYLRSPSGTYLGRYYRIYLCLMGAPGQVQGRIYRDNYYLVITPSAQPRFNDIRYQYLHFLLDPLAVKYSADVHKKASLLPIARQAPALRPAFKSDFSFLLTECLVRAVALRMDHPQDTPKRLNNDLTSGLILTSYFYSALEAYEKQNTPMSDYFDQMIQGIDVEKLESQLASVRFSAPKATQHAASPVLSPEEQLLNRGDNLIYLAKYGQAKEEFRQVLQKYNPKSERALYGMAVVATSTAEPDVAVEYFKQALAVAHQPRIVTWSHIYLGRIYDLEGKRQEALKQYHAAGETASGLPDALQAVRAGLQRPFRGRPSSD